MFRQLVFKAHSHSHGYPLSISISRSVEFPDTYNNINHCSGKFYGLQDIKILKNDELPDVSHIGDVSNKVLFIDFLKDAKAPSTTLPFYYEMPEGKTSIGMFARIPKPQNNGFEACVMPQTFENGPTVADRKLNTLGRFTVGVRRTKSSECSSNIVEQGTISFFNAILNSNYSLATSGSSIKALTSLVQRWPGVTKLDD